MAHSIWRHKAFYIAVSFETIRNADLAKRLTGRKSNTLGISKTTWNMDGEFSNDWPWMKKIATKSSTKATGSTIKPLKWAKLLLISSAWLNRTRLNTWGMNWADRTWKSINNKNRSQDRRFLLTRRVLWRSRPPKCRSSRRNPSGWKDDRDTWG